MTAREVTQTLLAVLLWISCSATCQGKGFGRPSLEIVECEQVGCVPGQGDSPVWTFSGVRGAGRFGPRSQPLAIEHLDASSIAVRRTDTTGPVAGLTALYMGRIEGQRVTGVVIYYDRNSPNWPRTGIWNGILIGVPPTFNATLAGSSLSLPFTLRECEGNQCQQPGTPYQITWTFPSRNGQGWLDDMPRPMIIEELANDFLIARRAETNLTAFYFGQLHGRQITGGVVYIDRGHEEQPRSGTWFGELQSAFVPEQPMSALANLPASVSPPPSGSLPTAQQAHASPESYPPPPNGIPNVLNGRKAALDFNGKWYSYYETPAFPKIIQIHQESSHITAETLNSDLNPTGRDFLRGELTPDGLGAKVELATYSIMGMLTGLQGPSWDENTQLTVLDPDHLQIGTKPAFERITLPSPNDVPCSSANEMKVNSLGAYMRAKVAQTGKDDRTALCWVYVSSIQGNANAEFYIAYFLLEGIGTPKSDPSAAFHWATKSAEHGSDMGAYLLAYMYEKGSGVMPDLGKSRYWTDRGHELTAQIQKAAQEEELWDQQQRIGMQELIGMGIVGLAVLSGQNHSNLCQNYNLTMSQLQWQQQELQRLNLRCDGTTAVPR